MADLFSRKNAMLGWAAWTLAKWQLRRGAGRRARRPRRFLRAVTAIAVLAALAAVWAKRSSGRGRVGGPPSGGDEPLT